MKDMKKKQMKVLAIVCALFALVGLGTAIYAAGFSSTITSGGHKGFVTSWSVGFGNSNFTDEVASTNNSLVISSTDIAPGSEGSFTVVIGNKSDVGANIYIDLYNARVGTGEESEINVYTALNQVENNIRFYTDDQYVNEITVSGTEAKTLLTEYDIADGTVGAKNGKYTKTIYWRWVGSTETFTDSNGIVQSYDNKIAGKSLKVDFEVVAKQTEPTA